MHKFCTILLIFFFSVGVLYASEELTVLLENWFAVENVKSVWNNETNTAELLYAAENFNLSIKRFTQSLLFSQYTITGLKSEENANAIRSKTDRFIISIKEENKENAAMEAEAIRAHLIDWVRLDNAASSQVFSHSVYIFAVFAFLIVVLIGVVLFLHNALRRSLVHEQESAEFTRIIMLTQEKERNLLSAELHDTVLQDMSRLLRLSEENAAENKLITELTNKVIIRLREICRTLMPPDFSRLALDDSLKQLCADFENRSNIECRTIIEQDFNDIIKSFNISPQMQLQIYRIVQEALTNIEKHSKATEVTLTVRCKDGKILLVYITDDGIRFAEKNASTDSALRFTQGLGHRGMYHRAEILGASLSFVPGVGTGLTVRLEVPLVSKTF